MHSLHSCTLHNAKVSKMPGGMCRDGNERKKSDSARVQGMQWGIQRIKIVWAVRKIVNSILGQDTFRVARKECQLPTIDCSHYSDCCHCDEYRRWEKKEGKDMFRDFFFSEKSSPQSQPLPWTLFVFLIAPCWQLSAQIHVHTPQASQTILIIIIIPVTMVNHYTRHNSTIRAGVARKLRHSEIP